MLGKLHTSTIRRFIPCLKFKEKGIYQIDWQPVDQYKADEYAKNKEEYWKRTNSCSSARPGTLPDDLDQKVKDLHFKLNKSYKDEIEHFTRLFVSESTRSRNFDTCVRDKCHQTAVAALNTAFYLLSDCIYSIESQEWYHGPYKKIYYHLISYKFWRLYTGRGLVWYHSGLQGLENQIRILLDKGSEEQAKLYSITTVQMRRWEEEQEKFWAHTAIPEN